jgi:hypothetical protein
MNLGFPYWDFIFTLIYNYSQGQWLLEGAAMIIFTAALTAAIVILAEYLYRRDTNAHPQPQLSTNKGRPNKLLITKLPLFKKPFIKSQQTPQKTYIRPTKTDNQ